MLKDRLGLGPHRAQAAGTAGEKGGCPQPPSELQAPGELGSEPTARDGDGLSAVTSSCGTQPEQGTQRLLPWHPGGTTEASTGSCPSEPCRPRVCPACRAGATPQAEGSRPPCSGHGHAAGAALTWPELPARVRGKPGKPGGAPAGQHGTGRGCSIDCSAAFGKRQAGTHLSCLHTDPSLCARERGDGLRGRAVAPGAAPPARQEHPGRGRSLGPPEIPTTAQSRCPQAPSRGAAPPRSPARQQRTRTQRPSPAPAGSHRER